MMRTVANSSDTSCCGTASGAKWRPPHVPEKVQGDCKGTSPYAALERSHNMVRDMPVASTLGLWCRGAMLCAYRSHLLCCFRAKVIRPEARI